MRFSSIRIGNVSGCHAQTFIFHAVQPRHREVHWAFFSGGQTGVITTSCRNLTGVRTRFFAVGRWNRKGAQIDTLRSIESTTILHIIFLNYFVNIMLEII